MKKIITLLILTLTLTSFTKHPESYFSIIGKWRDVDKEKISYIVFQDDEHAYFESQGRTIGGENCIIRGEKATMSYEVDHSKKPIEIDFIIKTKESGEINRFLCILEKIENNTIKLQFGHSGNRPIGFNDRDAVIFKRVK